MASKRLEDDRAFEAVLTCGVCLERLTRPKLLSCGHSFCQSCMCQWSAGGSEVLCPLCKRLTPTFGSVESLPDDFRYHQLVDSLREVKLEEYQDIQIFVNNFRGKHITIDVELDDDVLDLKKKIESKEGIPPQEQRLLHGGKQLEDGHKLREYKIQNGSTLQLVGRLKGGSINYSSAVPLWIRHVNIYRYSAYKCPITSNGFWQSGGTVLMTKLDVFSSMYRFFPDINLGCANVGPTSGRQFRRWANVGPTYIAVCGLWIRDMMVLITVPENVQAPVMVLGHQVLQCWLEI